VKPLLVDLETSWRGGQNQALLILKGLVERGHSPVLVAASGSALGQRAAAAKIPLHYVSRGLFRLPAAQTIRRLLHAGSFDLVHANEAHGVSAAWLAGAHKLVPVVISRRVGYPIGKGRLARARYEAAARIVANSQWVAEQAAASGAAREKLTVVYEGAEIPPLFTSEQRQLARARWGVSGDTPLLGCVGVLLPDKGQEWLIRALPEIRRDFPGTKLVLAGDGPCRGKLQSLARERGVADAVIFAGFVTDVESVYAALDVFLLPSFFEALNNSLLAAMAYQIPSVAFNRGALGEIIEDGLSGVLVEPANAPALHGAISKILRDPLGATTMAEAARKRIAEHFSAQKMVQEMIHVYESVVSRT
jgi:glycosyltransferase involved in cell wall biosynthesis